MVEPLKAAGAQQDAASATTKPKKAKAPPKPKTAEREMSTVAFPYHDLESVIAVARAINDNGGELTREQLAGAIKLSPASGNFMLKVSASRMFGLIDSDGGKLKLTDLGYEIISKEPAREKAARAAAFLKIPLYRRAYDTFKGKPLPGRPVGLEQAFLRFGVTPKRKADARLIFDKSAAQAGFYALGNERLIEPIIGGIAGASREAIAELEELAQPRRAADTGLDPLIAGLLSRLPAAGETWDHEKRLKWLQTLAANLDLVYPAADGDKHIIIESKAL